MWLRQMVWGILGVCSLSGCALFSPPTACITPRTEGTRIHLAQCWSQEDQDLFYSTSQGSQLAPYKIASVVELPDSNERFLSPGNVEKWKFLPSNNQEGWPIGFVKDVVKDGKWKGDWIGLNCSACHTGEIEYGGKRLRIDGSQALGDLLGFLNELDASLEATYSDGVAKGEKFDRLATHFPELDRETLLEKLKEVVEERKGWHERNDYKVGGKVSTHGYGRLDAFGLIFNEIHNSPLKLLKNIHEPNAPVNYPFLWDTHYHNFVQWNGVAPAIPMTRNVAQIFGAFGKVQKAPHETTIRLSHLRELQGQIKQLRSPRWPEDVLGKIDQMKAASGKVLFEKHCVSCHAIQDREGSVGYTKVVMAPVHEALIPRQPPLGTDPVMAENALRVAVDDGGDPIIDNGRTIRLPDQLAKVVKGEILTLRHPIESLRVILDFVVVFFRGETEQPMIAAGKAGYKARPLDGIWAAAPYLHNGSVPNLYELLLPPEQRSRTFYVGSRTFDPQHVGYVTSKQSNDDTLIDTMIPGNFNSGHVYGIDQLTEDDRWALVEYQKTL